MTEQPKMKNLMRLTERGPQCFKPQNEDGQRIQCSFSLLCALLHNDKCPLFFLFFLFFYFYFYFAEDYNSFFFFFIVNSLFTVAG